MKGDLYFVPRRGIRVAVLEREVRTYNNNVETTHYLPAKEKDVLLDLGETWNDNGFPKFLFLHIRTSERVWVKPEDISSGLFERLIQDWQLTHSQSE